MNVFHIFFKYVFRPSISVQSTMTLCSTDSHHPNDDAVEDLSRSAIAISMCATDCYHTKDFDAEEHGSNTDENAVKESNPGIFHILISTVYAKDDVVNGGMLECNAMSTVLGVYPTQALATEACNGKQDEFSMMQISNGNGKQIFHCFGGECTTFQIASHPIIRGKGPLGSAAPLQQVDHSENNDACTGAHPKVFVVISTCHAKDDVAEWGGLECNATSTVIGVYETEALATNACDEKKQCFPMSTADGLYFHDGNTDCTTFQIVEQAITTKNK